jgi:predicted DNA-binding transcriptional regulator AlpA
MTATELGTLIGLSRARIYQLCRAGRFPKPSKGEFTTRSFFSAEAVQTVLKIKAEGIALDGRPIVFNKITSPRKKNSPKAQTQSAPNPILDYLEGLGLSVNAGQLDGVLAELFPHGWQSHPQEEVVQKAYQRLLADSQ